MAGLDGRLVGRDHELRVLDESLDALAGGHPGALAVVGEPGIGKTRLLRELGARTERRGWVFLAGSASELEHDVPFAAFLDALDEYLASLEQVGLASLDSEVRAELASVFPSLSSLAGGAAVALHERYRTHRAMRALLERLAQGRPLVLALDDFHWADPASVELLGSLLRRPPTAVLIALTLRPRQVRERLSSALERSDRAGVLTSIGLMPLTRMEARELLAGTVSDADAALLYDESGGNPFYLQQLARSVDRTSRVGDGQDTALGGIGVPAAVVASLNAELGRLSNLTSRALDGASIAGDPFEPELAAAAAALSEPATMRAIDELLRLDVVRETDVPRRFRFRHPLVRRAVYEATPAGWRIGAHERCAAALTARGASAVARAHHVERAAHQGDVDAVGLLREAGEATARLAPESAARWFASALRLLPATAPAGDRIALLLARTSALAAAGRFSESHAAALQAVALVPRRDASLCTVVATTCASVERFLGRYEDAHARLLMALRVLPEWASVERVELLMELTLNGVLPLEIRRDARVGGPGARRGARGGGSRPGRRGGGDAGVRGRHDGTDRDRAGAARRGRRIGGWVIGRRALGPAAHGGLAGHRRGLPRPLRRGRRPCEPGPAIDSRDRRR